MVLRLCLVLQLLFFYAHGIDKQYVEIQNLAKLPILTPSLSEAKTAKIRLLNGLEAYIISDPNSDQSGASLTVKVGSWDDPEAYPGLAHFLEHMLFLGTSKYPQESEYDRYIKEHGGMNNAFTSNDFTSYMFSINNNAFEGALDRFSYFFKEPLFNPSGVARELQAIDQEYAQNVENDNVREIYVIKELSNPQHPYHRFNYGNSSTLGRVSQDTLKEWYKKHYSANLMRLVILSPLPLSKLIDLVVQDFKDIPNTNAKATASNLPIFLQNQTPEMVYIEPIKNIRTLTLVWDLPAEFAHKIETKPESLICTIIGHEGKESLLAQLKKENLAETLSCGSLLAGPNNAEFYISLDLTDAGVRQVNTVIERIFQALTNLRSKGIDAYIYDEVKRMGEVKYQYQQRQDAFTTMMEHGMRIAHEEVESYPLYTQVIQKFNPKDNQALIEYLRPENCKFLLDAPSSLTGVPAEKKEKWIGAAYAVKPIAKDVFESWVKAQTHPSINIPVENPYIPTHLARINIQLNEAEVKPIVPKASVAYENAQGKFYFAPDDQFLQPKVCWIFDIRSPKIDAGNPESVVLLDLYIKNAQEALSAMSYPAQMAGLNFSLERKEDGLVITLEGYSDKAQLLLKEVLKGMKAEASESLFKVHKSSLLREYQNNVKDSPLSQASEMLKSLIYKRYATQKEKASAVKKITFAKFSEFTKVLLNSNYVRCTLYGNMSEKQAKELAQISLADLGGEAYPLQEQLKTEIITLPDDGGPYYIENKIRVQGNAALLAIESIDFSFKKRAVQQILMQAISEPFFAQLRTKQQTGYLVTSYGEEIERKLFNLFAVQSNTHEPRDLLARFEAFIEGYLQELDKELTEKRFNNIKVALIDKASHPAKNIHEMGELLNRLAFKYDGDFAWMDKRVEGLQALTYAEFLTMSKEMLGKENKRRAAILLKGIIPQHNQFSYSRINTLDQLKNLSKFAH